MKTVTAVMWTAEVISEDFSSSVGTITLSSLDGEGEDGQRFRRYRTLKDHWVPRQYAIDLAHALEVPMEEV